MKYLLIFATLFSFAAQAQNDSHDMVMYDPLFWKSELSLRTDQSKKIEEINTEFYYNLRAIKEEAPVRDKKENNNRLEQGLQERSQKIYQTLLPRQRKKLEKIIDKNAIPAP